MTQIGKFLENNDIISEAQHGFRRGRSTATALAEFTDYINECLDSRKQVVTVFIDFKKAFDTLEHEQLIQAMHEWLRACLARRSLRTVVRGAAGARADVVYGVPLARFTAPTGGCVLPEYPPHGIYTVHNKAVAAPGQVYDSAILMVTCDPGYGVVGSNFTYCFGRNVWQQPMPQCTQLIFRVTQPYTMLPVVRLTNQTTVCVVLEGKYETARLVAFKTNNSLYSKLCNHKEKVDKGTRSGVYKLTCNDCSKVYVGQTGRSFNARFKEHVSAYRNEHPDKSNFAKHLLELNHSLSDSDSLRTQTVLDSYRLKNPALRPKLLGAFYGEEKVGRVRHLPGVCLKQLLESWESWERHAFSLPLGSAGYLGFCRLTPHPSINYYCKITGDGVVSGTRACHELEPHGTEVVPECNRPVYYSSSVLLNMRCVDGTWDHVAVCQPDCGTPTAVGQPLVFNGTRTKRGELPWHAGVYDKTFTPFMQICGGSLISTRVVISGNSVITDNNNRSNWRSTGETYVQQWTSCG
ncbi:hypothetical protein MSG28_014418 [Choristoneura fumiferana]|uniref:Uncharacterized protein n=1 Tax=Choristoneura fumiferana TaxID=7141 RepID=A0ACC0JRB6_CHOFU|nr:hypothetical protein MSG28_014418 [Choristoneura fumiferana]